MSLCEGVQSANHRDGAPDRPGSERDKQNLIMQCGSADNRLVTTRLLSFLFCYRDTPDENRFTIALYAFSIHPFTPFSNSARPSSPIAARSARQSPSYHSRMTAPITPITAAAK